MAIVEKWRNPLSRLQNRANPFQLCPLICQIRAFRLFWPGTECRLYYQPLSNLSMMSDNLSTTAALR